MKGKVETDNITKDVLAAEAAGYGPHYGKYIADHGHCWKDEEEIVVKPQKTKIYKICGKEFAVPDNLNRKYCSPECRKEANRRSKNEINRRWREKQI